MKKLQVSGKSVEEAVRNGLSELGVGEDRVKVTVLEQPSKGLFGLIGAKEARVELELLPDGIEEAISFLGEVAAAMGLNVTVDREEEAEAVRLNVQGSELGLLIGRRGQTLDSLQYLVNIVANRHSDRHLRIILDAEQFRERRRLTLEALADRMAMKAVKTGREVVLEPMTSHERKIIHTRLQGRTDVNTYSQGNEPNRRIVIALK